MDSPSCCSTPNLRWRQVPAADRWSDVYACSTCAHVHAMESWHVPLSFPTDSTCVNCGGRLLDSRCTGRCGLSVERAEQLHRDLASLHPSGDFLRAASAAAEIDRHVLALKLSSAALAWGTADDLLPRTIRLQSLERLGQIDRARDEAYAWSRAGAPPVVWELIAELEGAAGNVSGAISALQTGLTEDPSNRSMWTELAELFAHTDARGTALQAAARGLDDPANRARCLAVIADITGRYYQENRHVEALEALRHARDHELDHALLCWLHARLAEGEGHSEEAARLAKRVLELDPEHTAARALLERVTPRRWPW